MDDNISNSMVETVENDQEKTQPLLKSNVFTRIKRGSITTRVMKALKEANEIVDVTYFYDLLTSDEQNKFDDRKNNLNLSDYLKNILIELIEHFGNQTDQKSKIALAYAYFSLAELYYDQKDYVNFFDFKIKFNKINYPNSDKDRKYNKIKINFALIAGKISLSKEKYDNAFTYYKEAYETSSNIIQNESFTSSYQTLQQEAEHGMRESLLAVMENAPHHELVKNAQNITYALANNTISKSSLLSDSIKNTVAPIVDQPMGMQIIGVALLPVSVTVLFFASVVGFVNGVRNILSRRPLDENAQTQLIQKLSSTNTDEIKQAIITAILTQYNALPRSIFSSQSRSSKALLNTLTNESDLNKKWKALFNYVISSHKEENSNKNNGKAMFCIIDSVVNPKVKLDTGVDDKVTLNIN